MALSQEKLNSEKFEILGKISAILFSISFLGFELGLALSQKETSCEEYETVDNISAKINAHQLRHHGFLHLL